jgi:hypothetical protein
MQIQMTQANSNNTTTRRDLIKGMGAYPIVAASLAAGTAATGAVTAGLAATEPAQKDPAFALIDAMRAADIVHCAAIDAQDEVEARYGVYSDEAREAQDRCKAMCDEVNAIAWNLATTPPATLAGVAAVLRFANEIEDAGGDWPETDTIGPDGWHYQLRATMAAAVEIINVDRRVRS